MTVSKRLYKPGRHGHLLSHVCMLAARDTQLIPCCPGLHGTTWNHLETCAFAWLRACSTCAWPWPHMSPCLHVVPWRAMSFHGHMHSRYCKGTAVLSAWIHGGMVRHGPSTHGSIQMKSFYHSAAASCRPCLRQTLIMMADTPVLDASLRPPAQRGRERFISSFIHYITPQGWLL